MGANRWFFRGVWILVLGLVVTALALVVMRAWESGKTPLGAVEEVALIPWGIKMPARIDTGAAISSLDARSIAPVGKDQVEFSLAEKYGGRRIRMPVVNWQVVRSSNGAAERRPVIRIEIGLASKRFATNLTLADRSHMDYPVLIGRNSLEGRFLVDVTRASPNVPASGEAPRPITRPESGR